MCSLRSINCGTNHKPINNKERKLVNLEHFCYICSCSLDIQMLFKITLS